MHIFCRAGRCNSIRSELRWRSLLPDRTFLHHMLLLCFGFVLWGQLPRVLLHELSLSHLLAKRIYGLCSITSTHFDVRFVFFNKSNHISTDYHIFAIHDLIDDGLLCIRPSSVSLFSCSWTVSPFRRICFFWSQSSILNVLVSDLRRGCQSFFDWFLRIRHLSISKANVFSNATCSDRHFFHIRANPFRAKTYGFCLSLHSF